VSSEIVPLHRSFFFQRSYDSQDTVSRLIICGTFPEARQKRLPEKIAGVMFSLVMRFRGWSGLLLDYSIRQVKT
jgi:hypothetical protein